MSVVLFSVFVDDNPWQDQSSSTDESVSIRLYISSSDSEDGLKEKHMYICGYNNIFKMNLRC